MEHITLNYGLPLAYIALAIAAFGVIGFSVFQMVMDFKKAKTALIGIGLIVALFFISYSLSDNQAFTVKDKTVLAEEMRLVEAGIYSFYILLAVSILAIIYFSISRYFK
jgi:hypothetical protein